MKREKWLFVLVLCGIANAASATSDQVAYIQKGTVYMKVVSSPFENEMAHTATIFGDLAQELVHELAFEDVPIFVHFSENYGNIYSSLYTLGYGDFQFYKIENESVQKYDFEGLKLVINYSSFNIEIALKLIHAAISNVEYIKANQYLQQFSLPYFVTDPDLLERVSISLLTVGQYLERDYPLVRKLMEKKVYRPKFENVGKTNFSYYFQNGNYHFFSTFTSSNKPDSVVNLVLSELKALLEFPNYGTLVFSNDSTFFALNKRNHTIASGPFYIHTNRLMSLDLIDYTFDFFPIPNIKLFFYDHIAHQRVLFLTENEQLILDYDSLELKVVNDFLYDETKDETGVGSRNTVYFLLFLLLFSFLLNILLVAQLRKNKEHQKKIK